MELTEDEWFDVMREIDPELTREKFSEAWKEFQEYKAMVLQKRSKQ